MMADYLGKARILKFSREFKQLCQENDWQKAFENLKKMQSEYQ